MLAVVVVAVLAVALIEVRRRPDADLRRASRRSAPRSQGVEAEHLRPLERAVKAINAQFDIILGALPGIAAQGGDRRREEAAMTLWWIGDVVLLVVVLPVVVYLLRGVLSAADEHRPERPARSPTSRPRARRTSTPPRCC